VYSTTSRCLCHSESCANHAIKLAIILAASYSLSSSPRLTRYRPRHVLLALILVASYSLPYSSRLTRSHTRRVLLAIILAASYSLSYSSRPTRYRPRRVLLALILVASNSLPYSSRLTRSHTCRVLLAIVLAASYSLSYLPCPTRYCPRRRRPHCHPPHSRRAHRVVLIASCSSCRVHCVVLITSCSSRRAHCVMSYLPTFLCFRHSAMLRVSKTAAMDVTLGACTGNAKCGSSIYRCTLDIENRTGLSHYAWNPLHVCECDASICCNVPCLDSQRYHGAMTCIVRMPFALIRLRPEGKCPNTAASRRKMP